MIAANKALCLRIQPEKLSPILFNPNARSIVPTTKETNNTQIYAALALSSREH